VQKLYEVLKLLLRCHLIFAHPTFTEFSKIHGL